MSAHAANWIGEKSASDARSGSAEWTTLYSQYLLRVANQSAKTLELYQEVMDCVAQGALPATVLQDMQPDFVQARGSDYSSQFAEITMRFFAGVLQIGARYTNELSEVVAPAVGETPLQPPPLNVADPAQWFQQLNEYATQLNARAVRGYQSLLEHVATGSITPAQLQETSARFAEQHLPAHLRRLSAYYFELLNALNDLQTHYQEEFLQGVLDSVDQPDSEASFLLNLSAPLGETASAAFSLTNTTDAPTVVRCSASDIRRADGVGPAFAPQVLFSPDRLTIQPGDEASLTLSLLLDPDSFDPDALYVGTLSITGHGEPRFEVPLHIWATSVHENAHSNSSH